MVSCHVYITSAHFLCNNNKIIIMKLSIPIYSIIFYYSTILLLYSISVSSKFTAFMLLCHLSIIVSAEYLTSQPVLNIDYETSMYLNNNFLFEIGIRNHL